MRIKSCALPPVSAKPKPSIDWKCCASSTVRTGDGPASDEKWSGPGCSATSAVRSGVVSHSRASWSCCAFDDMEKKSRAQDEHRSNFSFTIPPLRMPGYPKDKRLCAMVPDDDNSREERRLSTPNKTATEG